MIVSHLVISCGGIIVKRLFLLAVAINLIVGLAACCASDPHNLFEKGTTDQTTKQDTVEQSTDALSASKTYYQYGNMQKNLPAGGFMLYENEVIFRFLNGGGYKLYAYNLEDKEVRPYCKDATCTHRGSCSYGVFRGNIEVHQGKIYSRNNYLQPVELTSIGQRLLAPRVTGSAFHHGNNLYVVTQDSSLVVFENGSNEHRVILDEYSGFWNVIFGKYLYANTFEDVIRIDLSAEHAKQEIVVPNASGMTDGEYIYYQDRKTNYLYRCDMNGSNSLLLVDRPVLPASINFDNEFFYFRLYIDSQLDTGKDCYDLYCFPKDNPKDISQICTMEVPICSVFTVPGTGKIFITSYQRSNGEDNDIYIVNTDGTDLTHIEIPEY